MGRMKNRFKIPFCNVCGCEDIRQVVNIPATPVFCNVLFQNRTDAINAVTGDISLCFCNRCGHSFNANYDSSLMTYNQSYDNTLHYSKRFREYVNRLVKNLVDTYHIHDKDIIDIGCGKGDFLELICDYGNNKGVGFDPSFEPERFKKTEKKTRFTVIKDYYSGKYAGYHADLIACRQVLEHIENPFSFLNMIARTIRPENGTILFLEVPNALYTLKDLGIWDLIHEHCSYFSSTSLVYLFNQVGLNPLNIEESFGGQYLGIEGTLQSSRPIKNDISVVHSKALPELVEAFSDHYYQKIAIISEKLDRLQKNGSVTVLWGAGSKGVTFLNVMKQYGSINWAVDISPHKHGKFIPGSGQEVIAPDRLVEIKPNHVLVLNPLYLNEIQETLRSHKVLCEIELV